MIFVADLVKDIRYTLADSEGNRWNDERLLMLINEAQKTIAKQTRSLRKTFQFNLEVGKTQVVLPADFDTLDSAMYDDRVLKMIDTYSLDVSKPNWEGEIGTPEYVVFDMQDAGKISLYPKPKGKDSLLISFDKALNVGYSYNVEKAIGKILTEDSYIYLDDYGLLNIGDYGYVDIGISGYGIPIQDLPIHFGIIDWSNILINPFGITDITSEYGLLDIYDVMVYANFNMQPRTSDISGAVTNIYDIDTNFYGIITNVLVNGVSENSDFGFVSMIKEIDTKFKIRYLRKPLDLISLDSMLEINDNLYKAVKYYVVSVCLREDMDTQNRTVANEYMQLYNNEIYQGVVDSSRQYINTNRYYEVKYFNGFN